MNLSSEESNKNGDIVLLIHGVGYAEPGTFTREARPLLRNFGFEEHNVYEYNWHALARYPLGKGKWYEAKISWQYLAKIISSFRGISSNDLDGDDQISSKVVKIVGILADGMVFLWCMLISFWVTGTLTKTSDLIAPVLAYSWRLSRHIVAVSLILGIIFYFLEKEGGSLRRLILAALRPFFVVSYLPFLIPTGRILPQVATIILATSLSGIIVLPYIFSSPNDHVFDFRFGLFLSEVASIIAIIGFFLSLMSVVIFSPVLKIISDIVRYAGDNDYRRELQNGLLEVSKSIGPLKGRRLFLVGHSLGSVIALDSLRKEDSPWNDANEVIFITMGSPLRRFFHRFFPNSYQEPLSLAQQLIGQKRIKCWINAFRPFDPIGTSIFKESSNDKPIRDISTKQFSRIFIWGHTNYWSDKVVADSILNELHLIQKQSVPSFSNLKPMFWQSLGTKRLDKNNNLEILPYILIPLNIIWVFFSFYTIYPNRELKRVISIQNEILKNGDTTSGNVIFHSHRTQKGSDILRVEFTPKREEKRRSFDIDESSADKFALEKEVALGMDNNTQYVVAYSKTNPSNFILPKFYPSVDLNGYRKSAWMEAIAALFFGTLYTCITLVIIVPIWNLYLGISQSSQD